MIVSRIAKRGRVMGSTTSKKEFFSFVGSVLALTLSLASLAHAEEPAPLEVGQTQEVKKEEKPTVEAVPQAQETQVLPPEESTFWTREMEEERELKIRAGATQYFGAKEDSESSTRLMLAGSKKFNETHSAQIIQYLNKYYVVNEGDNEVQFEDTILRHVYNPELAAYGVSAKWRTEVTAPASESSRKNEVLTKPQGALLLQKSFFEERLTLLLIPNFRYFINRYTTTPSPNGGKPLKEMSYGVFQRTDLKITEKWDATAYLGWLEVQYEDSGYKYEDGSGNDRELPKHEYFIDLSLSYKITEKFSFGLGYLIEKAAETPAGVEVVAFDYEVSNYYLSLSGAF